MREWLRDGFLYDLWANRQWAPLVMGTLEEVGWPDSADRIPNDPRARAADVFAHIFWGQRIWLERCGMAVESQGEEWIQALHDGWIAQVEQRDPTEVIRYAHPVQGSTVRPFSDIARHLVNHGTYHRGQIREIVEPLGLEIPETDFTRWRAVTAPPSPQ